jgi:hypothetical protein
MTPGTRRRNWTGAVLAAIALLLRLTMPTPPLAPNVNAGDLATVFDEHAFCRALAAGNASAPAEAPAPAPARHADHEHACCLWHAVASAALLPTGVVQPAVFAETIAPSHPEAVSWVPARLAGTARARAPPPESLG